MEAIGEYHVPVMAEESLSLLIGDPDGVYVDGTLGGGGHSERILARLGNGGLLVGIDRDPEALARAGRLSLEYGARFRAVRANFSEIARTLDAMGIEGADGILLDLGVSSRQLDEGARGFSFMRSGPLDMRMDPESGKPASELVNTLDAEELADIFYKYGEEHASRRVARAVVAAREVESIVTTEALAKVVERALGRHGGKHPGTKVFQALRIAVNGELEALGSFLSTLPGVLKPGGRVVVISYHSLEDRMVKTALKELTRHCVCPEHLPVCRCGLPGSLEMLTKKAVKPSAAEVVSNPRSRSARLRAARRLPIEESR